MQGVLTQDQRDRIAKNRAIAEARLRERKRELEETAEQQEAAQGHSAKRLSSATTPGRERNNEPSLAVAKALAAVEEQHLQRISATEWASFSAQRVAADSGVESGMPHRGMASESAEFKEHGQQRKQQAFLNFSGARAGHLTFGPKPGTEISPQMPKALMKRSDNVEKFPSAQGEKARVLPAWAEEGASSLTDEQIVVKDKVMNGSNVFLTGGAGTGKSYLVKDIIKALRRKVGHRGVGITATTGIAASPLGGTSLHSYAGIGLGQGSAHELADKIKKNRTSKTRWLETKVLIIDEISMLSPELLEKLEEIARVVKNIQRPFGGIQLLFVGDFLQLPPVSDRGKPLAFAFESRLWHQLVEFHFELQIVHRQENRSFVQVLNHLRVGSCNPDITEILRGTSQNKLDESGVLATKLYAKNMDVDHINISCLSKIAMPAVSFDAEDSGQDYMLSQLDKLVLAPKKLTLKEGAQVMLLKNLDQENGLVNGTTGVVLRFENNENADLGPLGHWPWVRFVGCRGEVERLITPDKFSIESQGQTIASRSQIPLRLAYAITIHKCQGMTLSKAELNLNGVFEYGQAYVALSRVQSLEGLRMVEFDPKNVKAHPKVLEFYKEMNRKNQMALRATGERRNPLLDQGD